MEPNTLASFKSNSNSALMPTYWSMTESITETGPLTTFHQKIVSANLTVSEKPDASTVYTHTESTSFSRHEINIGMFRCVAFKFSPHFNYRGARSVPNAYR